MTTWSRPIVTNRELDTEATLGVRAVIVGPPYRIVIPGGGGSWTEDNINRGELVNATDTMSTWLCTEDPATPGVKSLRLIAQSSPVGPVSGSMPLRYIVAPAWFAAVVSGIYPSITGVGGALRAFNVDKSGPTDEGVIFLYPHPAGYVEDFNSNPLDYLPGGVTIEGWGSDRSAATIDSTANPITLSTFANPNICFRNVRVAGYTGGTAVALPAASIFNIFLDDASLDGGNATTYTITLDVSCQLFLSLRNEAVLQNVAAGGGCVFAPAVATNLQVEVLEQSVVSAAPTGGRYTIRNETAGLQVCEDAQLSGSWFADQFQLRHSSITGSALMGTDVVEFQTGASTLFCRHLRVTGTNPGFSAIGGGADSGTVTNEDGLLFVDGPIDSGIVVNNTGGPGRCRYIQAITISAPGTSFANYGVDAVWVDCQVAGGTVELTQPNSMPHGLEFEVLSAPSAATYLAGTMESFTITVAGVGKIQNATSISCAHEASVQMTVDRGENRYRLTP